MIRETENGLFSVTLKPCTCSILSLLLEPIGYVWIHGHMPDTIIHWWTARIPLSSSDYLESADIRLLSYDLLMATPDFLRHLDSFDGISLSQFSRRVPDTLTLDRIKGGDETRVLLRNGLICRFYLPHAQEMASFSCVSRERIETLVNQADIKALVC